ncbi:MAG: hypothetical protein QW270_05690 [Candidatus Bathyarchaeia archaeon]
MLWESSTYESNICWVAPSNKIAYWGLKDWNVTLAEQIKNKLKEIATTYNLPCDVYGLPVTLRHDSLFGLAVWRNPDTRFNQTTILNLYNQSGYMIEIEISNSTEPISDWFEYADLLIYEALDYTISKVWGEVNIAKAKELVNKVIDMWDGYGLRDQQYYNNNQTKYETYKLALLYFACKKLNIPLKFEKQLITQIWKAQAPNGGIHTHYTKTGDFAFSDCNVETTAIVLYCNIPDSPSSSAENLATIFIPLIVAFAMLSICIRFLNR